QPNSANGSDEPTKQLHKVINTDSIMFTTPIIPGLRTMFSFKPTGYVAFDIWRHTFHSTTSMSTKYKRDSDMMRVVLLFLHQHHGIAITLEVGTCVDEDMIMNISCYTDLVFCVRCNNNFKSDRIVGNINMIMSSTWNCDTDDGITLPVIQ